MSALFRKCTQFVFASSQTKNTLFCFAISNLPMSMFCRLLLSRTLHSRLRLYTTRLTPVSCVWQKSGLRERESKEISTWCQCERFSFFSRLGVPVFLHRTRDAVFSL